MGMDYRVHVSSMMKEMVYNIHKSIIFGGKKCVHIQWGLGGGLGDGG